MHVERLQIDGIRGFHGPKTVDLSFTRPGGALAGWTVLAGRNGSGKSTLLQALALALYGPEATASVSSLPDWMSAPVETAEISAQIRVADADRRYGTPTHPLVYLDLPGEELSVFSLHVLPGEEPLTGLDLPGEVWTRFERHRLRTRPTTIAAYKELPVGPGVRGVGIDSLAGISGVSGVAPRARGWFYAGYGPFRYLGNSGGSRTIRRPAVQRNSVPQIESLFDATISLSDAVDWLIELRLLQFEEHEEAARLLASAMRLLEDGLLPDGFRVQKVTSDGLWVTRGEDSFPLREMSDGFRAVTALVVDILWRMTIAYPDLEIVERDGVPTLPYPGVVLIDEVDAHMHVNWQRRIGPWLTAHFPEIQFIVTTHSPYICQSADPGGLVLLPGPGDDRPPHVVSEDVYERVVYGTGDDAVLTELFGIEAPYSPRAAQLRDHLAALETKVYDNTATAEEEAEYRRISQMLTTSASAQVKEMAARLRASE